MILQAFRVMNFRSVDDSDWIRVESVTALIGTNEAGKTNLLLPLWKLKPAKEGAIAPTADYPRKRYSEIRNTATKPEFIQAVFRLTSKEAADVASAVGCSSKAVQTVIVSKRFDDTISVSFPEDDKLHTIQPGEMEELLQNALGELDNAAVTETEQPVKVAAIKELTRLKVEPLVPEDGTPIQIVEAYRTALSAVTIPRSQKRSAISAILAQTTALLDEKLARLSEPRVQASNAAKDEILKRLPKFVYYSNYGNLDSEIYLPHVIENMKRTDLGTREAAKVRTLKVLFDFVKLKPEEIHALGKEIPPTGNKPTEEQIRATAEKKKEREILLQAASAELTEKFRNWWKQGDYRFRFQADGDHFRIWVSDDRRPEEIELEGRSTGLQWFLSFYLIFLVESQDAHTGAILLLDEPGLSLHPIAQSDLSRFFENLAKTNQLLYTTHSPFLVDADHLDRVKAVYLGANGTTKVSADLRAGENASDQTKSIYPVHAALGLTVSEGILHGCLPVIVEGPSDQILLSAIKNYLIYRQRIHPAREIVFVPSGGVRGVKAIVGILTGKDERLPTVLLDSDTPGTKLAQNLTAELYANNLERVLLVGDLIGLGDAEIEDLIPDTSYAKAVTKYLRGTQDDFSEVYKPGSPVVPQVQGYAAVHKMTLEKGWKVDVARLVKNEILNRPEQIDGLTDTVEKWVAMFAKFKM